jgi:nucleoside-diphosphate-sugar epimerase
MRFLITGGSGFLGINLVRYLLERGHEVRSLDLVEFDYPDVQDRVEAVVGDIRDAATARAMCEGCEIVVHCAAALPLYSPEDIRTTDIEGTRRMLEASETAGVSRFVMISSTAVYGIPDHHPLFETDDLVGVG